MKVRVESVTVDGNTGTFVLSALTDADEQVVTRILTVRDMANLNIQAAKQKIALWLDRVEADANSESAYSNLVGKTFTREQLN